MRKKSSQSFLTLCLCLALLAFICLACNPRTLPGIRGKLKEWDEQRTNETEKVIERTPKLQELDNICKQVPIPENFKLIAKHLTWIINQEPLLSYFYYSEDDFDKSDDFFRDSLTRNGWQSMENNHFNRVSVFRKDNFDIHIQYGGIGADANYSIDCGKSKENINKK